MRSHPNEGGALRPAVAPAAVAGLRRVVERMAWRAAAAAFLPTPSVPSPTTFDSAGRSPTAIELRDCPWCARSTPGLPTVGAIELVDARTAGPQLPVVTLLHCESLDPRALLPVVLVTRACGRPPPAGFTTRAAWCAARVDPARDLDDVRMLAGILWRLNMAESWLDPLLRTPYHDPSRSLIHRIRAVDTPLPLPAATAPRPDLAGASSRETVRARLLGPHAVGDECERLDRIYRSTIERVSEALLSRYDRDYWTS